MCGDPMSILTQNDNVSKNLSHKTPAARHYNTVRLAANDSRRSGPTRSAPDSSPGTRPPCAQTLKVWDLARGHVLHTLKGHESRVEAMVVTPDAKRAVSTCWDRTVKIWELETGEVLTTFTCDDAARCCAFSDTLELIVAGDNVGHVHFLHLEEPNPEN